MNGQREIRFHHLKYESDGGPGIQRILEVLNESDQRDKDRKNFIKSQIVLFLLAAIDGHAKNFITLISPTGFELAPLYDVMSVDPFISPRHFPEQKINLAMTVGDNRHYRIKDIKKRRWLQSADKAKFQKGEIEKLISETLDQVPSVIKNIEQTIPRNFPGQVAEKIIQGLKKRSTDLASQ